MQQNRQAKPAGFVLCTYDYSETYGIKAINRARLIARAKFRCPFALMPVRFRENIRACGLIFAFNRVMSL